jgi:hypothetical protein
MKQLLFGLLLIGVPGIGSAQEKPWDVARVKPCDRACLTAVMDRYVEAMIKHDKAGLPVDVETRVTENTAEVGLGEGILWKMKVERTTFNVYVADPIAGQVALQTVLNIDGRPALVVIRLKVERMRILEVEQLLDRSVAPQAMELLKTPRPTLLNDLPKSERASREELLWATHSYFDALEGDNGLIGAFADDCVRHELGYQTVNNKTPGRAAPGPNIPPADSPMGKMSLMTCAQQVDTKIFNFITKIRPRRVLILDEQKGLAAAFPLFIEDGNRRNAPPNSPPGMIINMTTMETFGIRGGKIHEVEVFPFVVLPYGTSNGWTMGASR